ncbi:MAG: class I adenylate-forming enzyme family protein [Acidimicrobiales bacterium]
MPELVALDLPPGRAFVEQLRATWDAGDVVLPIDHRLPTPAARTLLAALAPSFVVGKDGQRRRLASERADRTDRGDASGGRIGVVAEGDALVVPTSGTTGDPKGAILTHQAIEASAVATSVRLGVDPRRDRWLACLPLAHIGGLSVVTRALLTGTPLVVHPRFDPASVERAARDGATLVSLVATALRRCDTSAFRAVLLGAAAPPEALPSNVVATYGMTETGSGVVYDGMPLDGVEVRIADGRFGANGGAGAGHDDSSEPTSPVPSGIGEVLLRGPMLLRCYRDGTVPHLSGGWFPTGDAGSVDSAGRLSVVGRMAEVIVTGGEKVWPAPVEVLLGDHPGVAEAAVWKRGDPDWGERVVAWIVPADPAAPPTLSDLRELVASELAPWYAPRELVIVPSIDRTPTGKVRRSELR